MSLGQRHWTTRLISQVLCCTIFLQTGIAAAGSLPAPRDTREWVSDERLGAMTKVELTVGVAAADGTPEPAVSASEPVASEPVAPEPVRIASFLQRPAPRESLPPSSILTDSAQEAETPSAPAVRPRPVEPLEEEARRMPVEVRPEDLPPFPPGMQGATLARAAGTLQAVTASSLIPSWNLASVQNEPVDKSPASVLSSIAGKYTRVFAYDACTPADPWKVYDPADAPGSDLTQIDQKIGFWIEMTAPASVPNPGALADETTIHLCPGWNLIGFPAEQARPVRTALSSIEGKYTRVFGFDPSDATDPWELYDIAVPSWANDLDLMQPGRGYWVLATAETDLTISNEGAEPEVAITAPADLGVVTTFTDVIVTVRSDRLQGWTLSYRPHGDAQETVFATGSTPVVNARVATLDPTLLLNGGYTIELTATDFNGQSNSAVVDIAVAGEQKIGHFTLSFRDLQIPLSGLAIEVIRNYDSRDKRRGDFGIGWTLELRQGSYRNNRKPGLGWQITSGFLPCQNIQESLSHMTTLRLSDQETYRFRLRLASPSPTLGGCFAQARFDFVDGPAPGATLQSLGNNQVIYQNDTDYVTDFESLDVFEPEQVRLTTPDGRIFDVDISEGVVGLRDLNANTLTISSAGITHSSGQSIAFERDGQGRITRITDPEGDRLAYGYDAAGDLVSTTDREGKATQYTYDATHFLLEIEDARGVTPVRNEYGPDGRVIRHTDSFGKTIEYDHQLGNRQDIITDRLGHSKLLEYDERGNIVHEVDADGKETRRTYDARDNLLSETDPLGNTTTRTYDANHNVTSFTNAEGNRTVYTYNSRRQVLRVLDPRGKLIQNGYDAAGNLTAITDSLGNVTVYTYDSRGNPATETDPEGKVTRFTYDAYGNRVKVIDPEGTETSFTYDSRGNVLTRTVARTTPSGTETLVWQHQYDKQGRLTRTTDPDGTWTAKAYDALGNVLESTDKLGRKTLYTYDASGRLTQTTFPDGTTEKMAYDGESRRASFIDRAGRTTRYEYDAVGREAKVILHDGASITNSYDAAGRLVAVTDARGNTTSYEYDRTGRRTVIRDALGNETRYAYDAAGNQISVTDARGATTVFEYDDAGRLVRFLYPDGTQRTVTYDRARRRVAETDPAGKTTRFGYDGVGRLTSVTDALGQVTRYTYDEVGNRTSQTDANGHVLRIDYDSQGRPIRRTFPLGASETLTYDAIGNLKSRTDANGATVNFTYDVNNRLTLRSYPNGSSVSYTYTPTGRRDTVTDSRGTTSYEYDARDRLIELTDPQGRRLSYGYDPQGNRLSLTSAMGAATHSTTFGFDALDRLATVTDPQGSSYTYGYDANGNRASLVYPNGIETTYAYDTLNRLRNLSTRTSVGGVIQSYAYTLGAVGQRTRIDEHDGTVRTFEYDDLYRLTRESVAAGAPVHENVFTYDAVGNRLSQDSVACTYDDRDRLLSEDGVTYSWDANGNLAAKSGPDGATYVWDYDNQLVRVTKADGTVVSHTYDADGNRVRTEVAPASGPSTVTEYLIDPAGELSRVVAEMDGAGAVTAWYVWGDDLLAVIRPGGTRYFHADGLGSVRMLTDDAGNVTDTYAFSAFGDLLSHAGSDPNAYLFAGEPRDPNSGFYYLRARWMDPRLGRFASMDPVAGNVYDPVSLHKYVYANLNPVSNTDPTGRFSMAGLNAASAVMNTLNVISMVYTGWTIGYGVGTIINGLLIEETMTLEEAAEEAAHLGEIAALSYLFNFGGLKIAASITRKLSTLRLIKLFSVAKINGRLAEHYIGNAYGMLRNTGRYIGEYLPDFINANTIREIKNVKNLLWTGRIARQLQAYADEAVATGRKFYIHIRPGTNVDPQVYARLEATFGPGSRGVLWDVVTDIAESLRVVP